MSNTLYSVKFILFLFPFFAQADLSYPYFANEERSTLIKNEFTKILIGDPKETVLKVLPAPDEILDLYNLKIYPSKIIGKTYWFIIQRKIASGSVIEKDEKLVRVSFNLQEKVTAVDHWGF